MKLYKLYSFLTMALPSCGTMCRPRLPVGVGYHKQSCVRAEAAGVSPAARRSEAPFARDERDVGQMRTEYQERYQPYALASQRSAEPSSSPIVSVGFCIAVAACVGSA